MLTDAEALSQRWSDAPPDAVAGDALACLRRAPATPATRSLRPEARTDAAALAALAERAWRAGEAVDAAEALPLYVRDKVAETTLEREARR